ncbi:hypothetical protein BGZ76_001560, partial [Entomortierella beljakovae]
MPKTKQQQQVIAPRSATPSQSKISEKEIESSLEIVDKPGIEKESSSKTVDKRKSFWLSAEVDALVEWLIDPDNHEKLNRKKPISGQKLTDIHAEIAVYINSKCQSNWDRGIVKSKIEYVKKKYDQARAISQSTGAGDAEKETLREQMLDICPHFDRFHEVYGGSLSRNPPSFKESITFEDIQPRSQPRKRRLIDDDESEESSDLEIHAADENLDPTSENGDDDRESTRSNVTPRGTGSTDKRPKKRNIKSHEQYYEALRWIQDSADRAEENRAREAEDHRKDLRRREMALEAREKDFRDKLLDKETQKMKKIYCLQDGVCTSRAFSIKIDPTESIDDLRKIIKSEKANAYNGIDADMLILWKVSVKSTPKRQIILSNLNAEGGAMGKPEEQGDPLMTISDAFGTGPLGNVISVIFQLSLPIKNPLFSDFSLPRSCTPQPVEPCEVELPVTTAGVLGLPRVQRRVRPLPESSPNFIFLDLPTNPTDSIPERFRSNVILQHLERKGGAPWDVPVFGATGCGKTRSVVELLYLQWGLYFNASETDLGSSDLFFLSRTVIANMDLKTYPENDTINNTIFAKNMTLLLFLSRILILNYCLSIPDCEKTFSSARWALLQVCPYLFRDIFKDLLRILSENLRSRIISSLDLIDIVRTEFLSARRRLVDLNFPNFTSQSKLRLVIDEAQILGDGKNLFESSNVKSKRRPLLSPVLHAFRDAGLPDELTIIYCGTGLSIQTLHWAISSGESMKDSSTSFPYIEFPGWTDQASIQSFIDRIKNQLPDEESKKLDALIPKEAVELMHQKLTGRFRYICIAIGMIIMAEPGEWKSAINNFENTLTSSRKLDHQGNLVAELIRLLFIYRWFILGESAMVLDDEARLVEAAFGRIKFLAGDARILIDEPFALKAAIEYFKKTDPLFIKAAQCPVSSPNNPSVHGNMWETMMPAVFVETFKHRPFQTWPLDKSISEQPAGDVVIVGYNEEEPKLAINYKDITMQEFMEAHIQGSSKQGDNTIPPFYFPAPLVSGPDIIFIVQINGEKKIPVFVQLKLRQVLSEREAGDALVTTSCEAFQSEINREQEKLNRKEKKNNGQQNYHIQQNQSHHPTTTPKRQPSRLQDYCPSGTYVSMVIAYPSEVVRSQFIRPDPKPELGTLKRVVININDSNFASIFPETHVNFLNRLKNTRRKAGYELLVEQSRSTKPVLKRRYTNPSKSS